MSFISTPWETKIEIDDTAAINEADITKLE